MPLFTFKVVKKGNVQLDLPLDTKIGDIIKPIADHFHLDLNEHLKMKFIYKSHILHRERTLESFDITPDSTIDVVYYTERQAFQNKDELEIPKKNQLLHKLICENVQNESFRLLYGFQIDEYIYALAYQLNNYNYAREFVEKGIARNENYIKYIDQIYSPEIRQKCIDGDYDDLIKIDIMIGKIISQFYNEDEEVRTAAMISEYFSLHTIKNPKLSNELKTKLNYIKRKKPGQIEELISKYKNNDRSIIISLPKYFIITLSTVKKKLYELLDRIPKCNEYYYVNPFQATLNDFMKVGVSNDIYQSLSIGSTLNFQQLKIVCYLQDRDKDEFLVDAINKALSLPSGYDEEVMKMFKINYQKLQEMKPENFVNPFLEIKKEVGELILAPYHKIVFDFFCNMNEEQFKILHEIINSENIKKNNVSFDEIVQILTSLDSFDDAKDLLLTVYE